MSPLRLAMDSASVSTASGDVTVGELRGGDAKFRTASGSLKVDRLEGYLNAQTASGDVTVAAAVRGRVSVQTGSGEVGVGIAEGTAAQLGSAHQFGLGAQQPAAVGRARRRGRDAHRPRPHRFG